MNKRYKKKHIIAINCRFIPEIMLCLIPQVLRLLEMRCGLYKRPGCFLIKVCWYDFSFSARLMNFAIVPAIFIQYLE